MGTLKIEDVKPGQILIQKFTKMEVEVVRTCLDWVEVTNPYRRYKDSKSLVAIHIRNLETKDEHARNQEALAFSQERYQNRPNEAKRRANRLDHHWSMDEVQQLPSCCEVCQFVARIVGRANCNCEKRASTLKHQ